MKLKYIIGILMFLLITVGTASAKDPTITGIAVSPNSPQMGTNFQVTITVQDWSDTDRVKLLIDDLEIQNTAVNANTVTMTVSISTAGQHYLTAKVLKKKNNGEFLLKDTFEKQITVGGTSSGSASDETFTINLINDKNLPNIDTATITVHYVPSTGTMTFTDSNQILQQGIVDIAYNLKASPISITGKK